MLQEKITPRAPPNPSPSHPASPRPAPAPPPRAQHACQPVVLIREVAEPGRVEEELGRYCSRSRTRPRRLRLRRHRRASWSPRDTHRPGALPHPRDLALLLPVSPHTEPGLSPAGPAAPTCSSWTWLTSQHPSLMFTWPRVGPSTEKVFTASS